MSQQQTRVAEVGDHGLKKVNMKTSTVVFMIFCLVSAGCFGIEEMIPDSGPGLTLVMLCVLPLIWAAPFGLVASELGSVRPQEGGYYKWVQEALGEFWGFQAGWWRTISIYIDNVSYVILAGGYAASQWEFSLMQEFIFKVAMILIFTFINLMGMKEIGSVSTLLSILVMIAFGMVAVCGFMHWGEGENISFQMTSYEAEGIGDWFFLIAGGISVGMWMYAGYESMSTIAGEVEDPQVIPRGTMITVPLIALTYIIPTVAGLGSLGMWTEWGPDGEGIGYGSVLSAFWGPAFGAFFVIIAILAQCSIFNTYIASGSRGFFSLADDNLAPPIMVRVSKKRGVPSIAIWSIAIFSLVLCMVPFGFIIVLDTSLLISAYVLVFISAMVLRKRIPEEEYKFRIPGGKGFLTLVCVVPICVAIFAFFINGSDYYMGGMVGLLSGPVLYLIWRRRYGGLTKKDAQLFPQNPKTRLAEGDLKRISSALTIFSVMNVIACFFMPWYESWGTEDAWESGDYFDGLVESFDVNIIVNVIQTGLYILTAVTIIGAIVTYVLSKKLEK